MSTTSGGGGLGGGGENIRAGLILPDPRLLSQNGGVPSVGVREVAPGPGASSLMEEAMGSLALAAVFTFVRTRGNSQELQRERL